VRQIIESISKVTSAIESLLRAALDIIASSIQFPVFIIPGMPGFDALNPFVTIDVTGSFGSSGSFISNAKAKLPDDIQFLWSVAESGQFSHLHMVLL